MGPYGVPGIKPVLPVLATCKTSVLTAILFLWLQYCSVKGLFYSYISGFTMQVLLKA